MILIKKNSHVGFLVSKPYQRFFKNKTIIINKTIKNTYDFLVLDLISKLPGVL